MKFALASYGTRGDVEPCTAVGRELQRRGHDVRLAVPPSLIALVESAGLGAAAYGPDQQDGYWDTDFLVLALIENDQCCSLKVTTLASCSG